MVGKWAWVQQRQSVLLRSNFDLTPFCLSKKILKLSDPHPPPPFMSKPPQNFGEPDSPPCYVPLSKKAKTHFLKI